MANPTFVIYDGVHRVPITLLDGVQGIQEVTASPNSIFAAGGGYQRYGDGEPIFGVNQQVTWEGGRGLESFVDDASRYFDSTHAWTATPNRLGPSPQAFFSKGIRPNLDETSLPGNVDWRPLYGDSQYISRSFAPSANITADQIYLWVKRNGTPRGNLTVEIQSDSSGDPDGTALVSATVDTDDIDDYLSVFQEFDWTGTQALTGSTTYHVVIYGDDDDDRDGHWSVAADVTGADSQDSSDGSTWVAAAYSAYYRLAGADIKAHHKLFTLDQAMYAVSIYSDGTNSRLWLNGDRGEATAGASTTLTNSNASFGTDSEFDGALVKIIRGTGNGQIRTISSHTGTVLTVSAAWDVNPSTDSEYIIYQTPRFKEITSTGLGQVQSVAVSASNSHIAYFGHKNSGDPIRKIRFNAGATPPAHEFADDSTNEANVLATSHIAGTGHQLWRAVNGSASSNISRAPLANWGTGNTFGTAFAAGDPSFPVVNMLEATDGANSRLIVFKPNEIGFVDSDKWYRMNAAIDAFPEATNGLAAAINGLYTYFGFSWSMERLYGTAIDDVDPNREAGFPETRQGYVSDMQPHPAGLFFSVDADDGYSSALIFDGAGFHEVFRAPIKGKSVKDVFWQANEGGKKYLWASMGDDLMYMEFPRLHRDPYRDSTQKFMHEWSLTTATFDMGNLAIPKIWKEFDLITQNFDGIGVKAFLDYQTDNDIGTTTWTQIDAAELRESPRSEAVLMIGDSTAVRFRIRCQSNIATTPGIVKGIVVKGSGFLPDLPMTSFWGEFGSIYETIGGSKASTLDLLRKSPAKIWKIIESEFKLAKGRHVAVRVVSTRPQFTLNEEDNVRANLQFIGLDSVDA